MSMVAKPYTFSANTSLSSSQMNANFDTLYNDYNGGIAAANLASNSVITAKIADSNVTTAKIADDAVTTAKILDDNVTAAKIEEQEAWINVTYTNSWVDYDTTYGGAQYMKDSLGFVHIRGLVKNGSAANAAIFTLPVGYRPNKQCLFASVANAALCRIDVSAVGVVNAASGGSTAWTSLYVPPFKAET